MARSAPTPRQLTRDALTHHACFETLLAVAQHRMGREGDDRYPRPALALLGLADEARRLGAAHDRHRDIHLQWTLGET
jgi:hypothetical protein